MGIFDFLFKRKNKEASIYKKPKPHVWKQDYKVKHNKEFIHELDLLIKKNGEKSYYFNKSNDNRHFEEYRNTVLDAFELASGNIKVEDITNSKDLSYYSIINNFLSLIKYNSNNFSENIRKTVLGLIRLSIYAIHKFKNNYTGYGGFNFLGIIFTSDDYKDNFESNLYNISYFLEELSKYSFRGKLYFFIDLYYRLDEKYLLKFKNEILDYALNENKIAESENLYYFNTKDELSQYLEVKMTQQEYDSATYDNSISAKEAEKTYQNFILSKGDDDNNYILLLALYEYFFRGNNKDKKLLNLLIKKANLNYATFQSILLISNIYGSSWDFYTGFIISASKNYLKNEPLDLDTYRKLKEITLKTRKLSQLKSINNFLYSKKDSLYNIPEKNIFHLLHSGVYKRYALGRSILNYSAKSEYNKIINELLLLLSQAISTELVKEAQSKGYYIIKIGNKEFPLSEINLLLINEILSNQNIPYQLIDTVYLGVSGNNRLGYFSSTILITIEEYHNLESSLPKFFSIRYPYGEPRFIKTEQEVKSLINNIKKIKFNKEKIISGNRFVNDITWKGIKSTIIDNFPNKTKWYEIMHLIVSYSGSVLPTSSWQNKIKPAISEISPEEFELGMDRLNYDCLTNNVWFNKANVKALRGIIWANTYLSEFDACDKIEALLMKSYESVFTVGPRSIRGGNSCMAALVHINTEESYKRLYYLEKETSYHRFKNDLKGCLLSFKNQSSSMVFAVQESLVDDMQFIDGKKIISKPPYYIHWTIHNRKAQSKWIDELGNKLKKTPKFPSNERVDVMSITKSINKIIQEFDFRTDNFKYSNISYSIDQWKNAFVNHNLIQLIIDNFLWILDKETGESLVFITKNNKCFDIENNEVVFEEKDQIKPFSRFVGLKQTNQEWINYFIENKSIPAKDYFFNKAITIEQCENILNEIYSIIDYLPVSYLWKNIKGTEEKSIAKNFDLLQKVALLQVSTDENSANKWQVTYHNTPLKNKEYRSYDITELGEPINPDKIQQSIRIEFYNDIILRVQDEYKNKIKDDFKKLLIIPEYNFLNKLFSKVKESGIFNNLDYKDFEITINGELNTYVIPILSKNIGIKIEQRTDNKFMRFFGTMTPSKNYQDLLKIPFVTNSVLNKIFFLIEQLTNDIALKNKDLKKWVKNEN